MAEEVPRAQRGFEAIRLAEAWRNCLIRPAADASWKVRRIAKRRQPPVHKTVGKQGFVPRATFAAFPLLLPLFPLAVVLKLSKSTLTTLVQYVPRNQVGLVPVVSSRASLTDFFRCYQRPCCPRPVRGCVRLGDPDQLADQLHC